MLEGKGGVTMSSYKKYLVVTGLGVVAGGIFAAWAINAIPRVVSGVMQNMVARMREAGCDPTEI